VRSEKILVFLKPKFLGDAVMATPLLSALRGAFSKIEILAPAHIQEMLREDARGMSFVNPLAVRGVSAVFKQAAALRKRHYDIVLLVNRSVRSAMITRLAGIPVRVGHSTEGRGALLTKRIPFTADKFEAECYGDLARLIGVDGNFSRVHLTVTREEREQGSVALQGAEIGVQPGARFAEKRMPIEPLSAVVRRLQGEGLKVCMVGGSEEKEFAAELQKRVDEPLVDLVGRCSLRESMGAISEVKVCIGASTGIMHIAAALGTPTVTVLGQTDPVRWGHRYGPHQTVKIASGNMEDMDADEVFTRTSCALRSIQSLPS